MKFFRKGKFVKVRCIGLSSRHYHKVGLFLFTISRHVNSLYYNPLLSVQSLAVPATAVEPGDLCDQLFCQFYAFRIYLEAPLINFALS